MSAYDELKKKPPTKTSLLDGLVLSLDRNRLPETTEALAAELEQLRLQLDIEDAAVKRVDGANAELREKVEQMEYAIREDMPRWEHLTKIEAAAKEYVAESGRQKYNVQPEFYRLAALFNRLVAALNLEAK